MMEMLKITSAIAKKMISVISRKDKVMFEGMFGPRNMEIEIEDLQVLRIFYLITCKCLEHERRTRRGEGTKRKEEKERIIESKNRVWIGSDECIG